MDIRIEGSSTRPSLLFNAASAEWIISGRCYHNDPRGVFEPVFSWLRGLERQCGRECRFQFRLEFFDTASYKVLLDMLAELKRRIAACTKVELSIQWFYEADDEDMRESGETLMEALRLPFELIGY